MKNFVLSNIGLFVIITLCATGCREPSDAPAQSQSAASDGLHGSHANHSERPPLVEGRFPTVGFDETHQVTIPYPLADVMPLFEPNGRHLIYTWWNPTVVKEAKGETLKGLVTISNMHSHDIYLIVTEHKPNRGHIQYLVLWDDFELQRIDITCTEGETQDSTRVVWAERNAGLHEKSVSMVSKFVEGGHLKAVVERYAKRVEEHLQKKG